jgi:hypothetical protein
MLAARGEWRHFPVLRGVIESPCLRPDGSLLDLPGYDRETGLLLIPRGAFPTIPTRASIEDARRALETLWLPIREFPYVAPCDASAALAAILALVGRFSVVGPCPMTFYRSTVRGSGKSLLQKITGALATGRIPPMRFNVRDPSEVRKSLYALALAGARYIAVDNVAAGESFGNEVWAAALTTGWIDDRILGKTESKAASLLGVTFTGSGNNTTFRCDLGRRVIPCDIDPACERPEERTFAVKHLEQHVVSEWRTYAAAALVVLRAHAVAGWPSHGGAPLGSFEEWDERVRAALIWCGKADPCEGRVRVHDEGDEDVAVHRDVVREWARVYSDSEVTLAEVLQAAEGDVALRSAMEAFTHASPRRPLDGRSLGYAMRATKGRVSEGSRFVTVGATGGSTRWKLEPVTGPRGDGGDRGHVPSASTGVER